MPELLTPGVYTERARPRPLAGLARTDVAGFVGLAAKGPLHRPVRLTSLREFQDAFGGFLPHAHLAYAVRAFFDNGGAACWAVRVADVDEARAATVAVPLAEDGGGVAYRVHASSPGTWGNNLAVRLQPAQLGAARQDLSVAPAPARDRLAVDAVAGFAAGSRVRLTQAGSGHRQEVRVEAVDPVLGTLRFAAAIDPELDPAAGDRPLFAASLEFDVLVLEDGRVVERLDGLAPDAGHPRDAVRAVEARSRFLRLERAGGAAAALPRLPFGGALEGRLDGGRDGLRGLTVFDHVGTPGGEPYGLAAFEAVDEVAMLAMPDLAAAPRRPPAALPAPPPPIDVCDPAYAGALVPVVEIAGTVRDGESGRPLAGVAISDGREEVLTGADGRFALPDRPPATAVELLVRLAGWADLRLRVNTGDPGAGDLDIRLAPLDLPPVLADEDVFFAQQAMVAQCERRRDRMAILDAPLPPAGDGDGSGAGRARTSAVTAWRARFASAFAALYHPWLVVRDPLAPDAARGRSVPPSGHAAGVWAALDREEGVHRPPANRALAGVEDLDDEIDDRLHAVLNPLGVNAVRAFPGRGIRIFGARTLAPPDAGDVRYVNVRRLLNAVIEAIEDGLQWAVFEPNDAGLRLAVQHWLTQLADGLWRRGALVGGVPEAAYRARCDDTTTTPEDRAQGRLIGRLDLAPVVPYEFVVVRLGITTDELRVSEESQV